MLPSMRRLYPGDTFSLTLPGFFPLVPGPQLVEEALALGGSLAPTASWGHRLVATDILDCGDTDTL